MTVIGFVFALSEMFVSCATLAGRQPQYPPSLITSAFTVIAAVVPGGLMAAETVVTLNKAEVLIIDG